MEQFRFSHQSRSGHSPELQPAHVSFPEHRQQASPHLAIPISRFICISSIPLFRPYIPVNVFSVSVSYTHLDVYKRQLEALVESAGGIVTKKAAVLAEGNAAERDDIIFLQKLPLFQKTDDDGYEIKES